MASIFNASSIWWTFHFVNDWAARKFNIMNVDISAKRQELQQKSLELADKWDQKALSVCSKVRFFRVCQSWAKVALGRPALLCCPRAAVSHTWPHIPSDPVPAG